jgi:hypothetical protein
MIKSVISSAARLPLAPARLTGRISESLLRQLRGNGASEEQPGSSPRDNRASRSRAKPQPKRAASRSPAKAQPTRASRAKAQPKQAATGSRAKAEPKQAATRRRAKAQPKRAPRPKPLDDATIARKVESTVFRDLDVAKGEVNVSVDEGVVSLGGEVPTPDLIKELEARATRITEVRRVENQLQLPKMPASGRTDMPAPQPETSRFQRHRPEDRAVVPAEISEDVPTPAAALRSGGEPTEPDEPDVGELDQDPADQPSDPSLRGLKGG